MSTGTKKRKGSDKPSVRQVVFTQERYDGLIRDTGKATVIEDLSEQDERGKPLLEGWSKNAPDPMKLLERFHHLRMKKGYVLRNYLYQSFGGSHSAIFAMPQDAPFPEPEECMNERECDWDVPIPEGAIEDFMLVVTGDKTPESYMSASMFARDVSSLGASWHGVGWGAHHVLFRSLFSRSKRSDEDFYWHFYSRQWEWHGPRPRRWAPRFEFVDGTPTVTFHTYTGLGRDSLLQHTDRFRKRSYRFTTKIRCLASGPGGYVY